MSDHGTPEGFSRIVKARQYILNMERRRQAATLTSVPEPAVVDPEGITFPTREEDDLGYVKSLDELDLPVGAHVLAPVRPLLW